MWMSFTFSDIMLFSLLQVEYVYIKIYEIVISL